MFDLESDEHRLILACAKPLLLQTDLLQTEDDHSFSEAAFDWNAVIDLAAKHRVAPLLYNYVKRNQLEIPVPVLTSLKAHVNEQALANLFQTKELIKILDRLAEAGVDAMPFKGPALGQYLYNNLGLRPFCDLDILIHRDQFAKTRATLLANDFRPYRELSKKEEERFLDTQMGFEFIRNDEQSVIEVHWSFLNTVHAFRLSEKEVWRKSLEMELLDRHVRVFSPAHLLVYLCAHGSKSLWSRLRWICDVAELVSKHQEFSFWEEVVQLARSSRSNRMLSTGLILANMLLNAPLPEYIQKLVFSDRQALQLAQLVTIALWDSTQDATHAVDPVRFHLQMHERFIDRLPYYKHLFQIWSAPSNKDKAFVSLPRYLEFLYILIKPIRMILNRGR